jgi:hypothetical protein
MQDAKIQQNTEKLIKFIAEKFEKSELNNESLVELIQLCGAYLNLETIPNYAKRTGMSYEGVKKGRNIVELFGCKLVIDND